MILSILAYSGAVAGTIGQWLDGFTTYIGVKKAGPSIEGDKSWFAQFCVHHPSTLLYLKALIFAGIEYALIYCGPHTNDGGYFVAFAAGVAGAIMGGNAALGNYETNKGLK